MIRDQIARPAPDADPGFGVYVHWPFCLSKCPYCDFNSHVRGAAIDEERYLTAFRAEIAHRATLAPGRTVASVFFGGGTPSLMRPQTVQGVLDAIAAKWRLDPDAEITLEANPTSVEAGRFRGYRAAGVNRLSIGVQSLSDAALKALGRKHTVDEAIAAVKLAASLFPRFTFDLIYARPGQSEAEWRSELSRALDFVGDHVSLYQLTIEPDTIFERLRDTGKLQLPDEDLALALFAATRELTEARGLPAYEVSNHARPGGESRHNLIYWRYGEYAGVGPGAHGRLATAKGRFAQETERHPEMWLTQVETEGHGLVENTALSREEQGDEFLLMGLRLREGIDPRRFERLSGREIDRDRVKSLVEDGFIELDARGRLRVTPMGAPLLDTVVADVAA
ncbi:MAG: radical SAM family heme chaperone HemW [Roseiarcus sp.]|uniref:radical SAM family heme chaperone HemW n=1 Tax=Roseiarcus sp. TaxID=1969460 RepID=UPI003BAFA1A8